MAHSPSDLDQLAEWIVGSSNVVILTGAGVSAESGLATFRDPSEHADALWSKYDPMELATAGAFERDPELVTRWYHWRFTRVSEVEPNPGHFALAGLERWLTEQRSPEAFTMVTQNIDGLHQRAGSKRVVELHGTIHTWRCTKTGQEAPLSELSFESFPVTSTRGGLMRPCIVWFGEALPDQALALTGTALERCDLFVSIGTSATVQPAASFVQIAKQQGAKTVEINRDATPITDDVDMALAGASGEVLPDLLSRVQSLAGDRKIGDT
ncbi:MAG: NAD-dependent deacylase [Phycisphaerales bacterium]